MKMKTAEEIAQDWRPLRGYDKHTRREFIAFVSRVQDYARSDALASREADLRAAHRRGVAAGIELAAEQLEQMADACGDDRGQAKAAYIVGAGHVRQFANRPERSTGGAQPQVSTEDGGG